MAMFKDVLETVRMIEKENLDIRTITMGISLMDCIDADGEKARRKIYDKITRMAEHLVSQGERIETEFGIPIVNKRVSVTPISLIAGASNDTDYVAYAETLDKAAHEIGVNFIGGFSALVPKGFTRGGPQPDQLHSRGAGLHRACLLLCQPWLHQNWNQHGRG